MNGQNLKNISNVVALSMAFYVYAVEAVTTNFWSHLVVSVEGFARVVAHDEWQKVQPYWWMKFCHMSLYDNGY